MSNADKKSLEDLHGRAVDQINDMLIPFQDASFAVGRNAGCNESAVAWDALAELVKALDGTNWSSWQTTANFDLQLVHARGVIAARQA